MKKLLILLALCVISLHSYAQERDTWEKMTALTTDTTGSVQDEDSMWVHGTPVTTTTDTLFSRYQYVLLTVQDTGTVFTDSLIIETLDMNYKVWSPVAVLNLSDGIIYDYCIPGAGVTRKYLIYDPNIYIFRVRLLNSQIVQSRTVYLSYMAKKY